MTDEANDALRKTVEAQAERIRALERQLEAKSTALDIASRTLARHRAQPRHASNIAPSPEQLPWRTRLRGAVVIFGGKLLPRPVKQFVKKFWDPWAPIRRHPKKEHRRDDEKERTCRCHANSQTIRTHLLLTLRLSGGSGVGRTF